MYNNFLCTINRIINSKYNSTDILLQLKLLLNLYKSEEIKEMINTEINKKFDINKLNVIRNDQFGYYKYNLIKTHNFDIYDIKWEKDSFSKIHDHPDKGCIMYMYNNGNLTETNFINYEKKQHSLNNLYSCNIAYKIGDKYLHKIYANKFTETLHIYIPGNHKTTYYTL